MYILGYIVAVGNFLVTLNVPTYVATGVYYMTLAQQMCKFMCSFGCIIRIH